MHEIGCSGLVHWDDPEGWDGEGGGKGIHDGALSKRKRRLDSLEAAQGPFRQCWAHFTGVTLAEGKDHEWTGWG